MDIDSLGEGKVEILYEQGLLSNIADLYKLKYEDILGLEKTYPEEDGKAARTVAFKDKTARNIINGIDASLQIPFERVLFALGIRHVGETVAKTLARHFKTIDAIAEADLETLTDIHEIGEKIASSLLNYFRKEENLTMIATLKEAGLKMNLSEERPIVSQIFA